MNSLNTGRGQRAAGRTAAHRLRRVEADEDAGHQVGGVADEPGVLFLVGGAGLAGGWAIEVDLAGAVPRCDHAFHHRGDLVGGHRVEHLLAGVDNLRLLLGQASGGDAGIAACAPRA
jgi:hypothetical protein